MTEAANYPTSMREIEARMQIDPLDVLQADRSQHVEELAQLRAFEKGYEPTRKAFRSVRIIQLRDGYIERGEKVPGWDLLEAEACADQSYLDWLDEATTQLARKEVLEFRVLEITEAINRGQVAGRYVTAERFGG